MYNRHIIILLKPITIGNNLKLALYKCCKKTEICSSIQYM